MTLEQIKSAPDFKYAPDPLAQLDQVAGQRRGAALVAAVKPIARARTGVTRG